MKGSGEKSYHLNLLEFTGDGSGGTEDPTCDEWAEITEEEYQELRKIWQKRLEKV